MTTLKLILRRDTVSELMLRLRCPICHFLAHPLLCLRYLASR